MDPGSLALDLIPHAGYARGPERTRPGHRVEIEYVGEKLLRLTGAEAHDALWIDDQAPPQPRGRRRVQRDDVELVEDRVGARHDELRVSVAGRRKGGLEHDLGAHPGELAKGLGKVAVVADRESDPAEPGNVEGDETIPRRARLVRLPGED